jgi:hypothetical protein
MATSRPDTAPAAHLVTVQPDPEGRGLLVGHLNCPTALVFVPLMPGQPYALAIDVIQPILSHVCPPTRHAPGDDPAGWIEP